MDDLYTCDGCHTLLDVGIPHDCPATGAVHLLERDHEMTDWDAERKDVLERFEILLAEATGDGSAKRQRGEKPVWYNDDSHEAAMFSHLTKWKRGELVDADSGAHPLVHLAWRALAIACIETGFVPGFDISDTGLYTNYPEEW